MPYPTRWPHDNPELLALYQREWAKKGAHPCVAYTNWLKSNYEKNQNLRYEQTKNVLDYLSKNASSTQVVNTYYANNDNYKANDYTVKLDYMARNDYVEKRDYAVNYNNKPYEKKNSNNLTIIVIVVFLVLIASAVLVYYLQNRSVVNNQLSFMKSSNCSDGTLIGACSSDKPYYCNNSNLVYNPNVCGCPVNTVLDSGYCRQYKNCADGTRNNNCSKTQPLFCFDGNLSDNVTQCGCGSNQLADGNGCRPVVNCSDGTPDTNCSTNQPYYCFNGTLIQKASLCGCPSYLQLSGDDCFNPYPPDTLRSYSWEYNGMKYQISLNLSSKLASTLAQIPNTYTTSIEQYFDSIINNTYQQPVINDIIKQVAGNGDQQLLTALAMVQTLPYDYTSYKNDLSNPLLSEARYPYKTLYDQTGVCEDKSLLGASIAEQMGYGVALFQYNVENHMALGIKCPLNVSNYNSGYCFLEMTTPCSKLTYNQGNYTGGIQLTSTPQIIVISDGKSLSYSTVMKDINEINNYNQALTMMNQLESEISSFNVNVYDANSVNNYNALVNQYYYYVNIYDSFNSCNTS
jgi:hypothetical protein